MTLVVWDDLAATAKDHPVLYGVSLCLQQAKIMTLAVWDERWLHKDHSGNPVRMGLVFACGRQRS